ncbi:MAG: hypothetical protein WC797_03365 [Candidatus Paceibacterota bacterium]|jgi:hypothetical protein
MDSSGENSLEGIAGETSKGVSRKTTDVLTPSETNTDEQSKEVEPDKENEGDEKDPYKDWDETLKDRNFTFENIDGRKTDVLVLHSRIFSGGAVGTVHECVVSVAGRERRFVIKTLDLSSFKQQWYSNNFKNYERIRSVSSKVFTTFRRSLNDDAILMTMENTDDQVCLGTATGPKTETLNAFGYDKVDEVKNFEDFLKELFSEMRKMTEEGIGISPDTTFLLMSRPQDSKSKADFIFGDLDQLSSVDKTSYRSNFDSSMYVVRRLLNEVKDSWKKSRCIDLAKQYFLREGLTFSYPD